MPDFNPNITLYSNVNALKPPIGNVPFTDVLDDIRDGKYKVQVDGLRGLTDEEYNKRKRSLPAVTFSGTFRPGEITSGKNAGKTSYRFIEGLDEYTHIILYDIDKLEPDQLQTYRQQLQANPYVLAVFVSPSRRGLKILFRESSGNHVTAWAAINHYLRQSYGIQIDESGKDVCRLCFVSYDPDIYYNPDCDVIDALFVEKFTPDLPQTKPAVKAAAKSGQTVPAESVEDKILAKCHEIVQQTVPLPNGGGYNKYTNCYALNANRYGITEADCWSELDRFFPFAAYQDQRPVVASVYSKFAGEHGSWTWSESKYQKKPRAGAQTDAAVSTELSVYHDEIRFWYPVTTTDRNGKEVITDYKISYDDSIIFMQNNGFYKYRLEGHRYQLIHVQKEENIVDVISELRVKEFMIDYLKSRDRTEEEFEFKRVREIFRRGAKNYCSASILEGLDYYRPQLRRDTATSASLYFSNCFIEVTKDDVFVRQYSELQEQCLWKKQVRDQEFHKVDWMGCDVSEFLSRAILGEKVHHDRWSDTQRDMMMSVCTTVGYLLHRYKNPSVTKAVIATDKVLRRGKENEGRTGKSLLAKCIKYVVNVTTIEGRNFSFDKPFPFQQVNIDTEIINLNDVKKAFDFTRLFGMVTEEFSFEKKNQDMITVPFEDAPKFYISANTSLRGDGASTRARQQVIEFSNYYTETHQPTHASEFGRHFFSGWDAAEWNRFYSFMVYCLQMYLKYGLKDFPLENYGMNKLIDRAGEEFVDFMDDNVLNYLDVTLEFKQEELYAEYIKDIDPKYRIKSNEFTARVKMWAEANGLVVNPHKNGERDRRNKVTYLRFAKIGDASAQPDSAVAAGDGKLNF